MRAPSSLQLCWVAKLSYALRTCSPLSLLDAQVQFDQALRALLEKVVTALDSLGVKHQRVVKESLSASLSEQPQVKDIVKEVEDYLKTYSSAGMDISWYVEGIRYGSKESQRWQYSNYLVTL
ncbi:hypothetical protein Tco_1128020 [Tanacetum coccineum]